MEHGDGTEEPSGKGCPGPVLCPKRIRQMLIHATSDDLPDRRNVPDWQMDGRIRVLVIVIQKPMI